MTCSHILHSIIVNPAHTKDFVIHNHASLSTPVFGFGCNISNCQQFFRKTRSFFGCSACSNSQGTKSFEGFDAAEEVFYEKRILFGRKSLAQLNKVINNALSENLLRASNPNCLAVFS